MLCPNMAPFLLLVIFLTTFALSESDESVAGMDDGSSLPMLSGKRQHNIMRFGKRPSSGGHNLIHFGKRGNEAAQHRFLYLGKREDEEEGSPIFPFLQREDNFKRGHTIMRFGKRAPPQDMHSFIRFGKRDSLEEEEEKRGTGGHSMMYFGKRGPAGHNMMYFGKRGSGHSMLYFGKRDDDYEPDVLLVPEEEAEKRAAHSMIHFGKREDEEEDTEESKRGGGSHSMIHFGKRPYLEEQEELNEMMPIIGTPEEKRSILRFGKKTEGSRARNSHAMIHFGKRSTDNDPAANKTEEVVTRTKRDAPIDSVESVLRYYYPRIPAVWDENSNSLDYENEPEKKDGSKNVFLRFG